MTANTWVRGWSIASRSDPNTKHRVSQARDGHFGCSCGKWCFAKKPKPDCHHIVEVKNNLGLLERVAGIKQMEKTLPGTLVRAELSTPAYIITELSAQELITLSKRKVRRCDEF